MNKEAVPVGSGLFLRPAGTETGKGCVINHRDRGTSPVIKRWTSYRKAMSLNFIQ